MRFAVTAGQKFTLLFLALLGVGLAISYGNSFGIGFYFDDSYGIASNPAIRSLRNIPLFFTDPFTLTTMRENVDIRPVLVTTFAINYAISGNEPWSYHVLNLILHFIAAGLVYVIVRDHLWWPAADRGPNRAARLPAAAAARPAPAVDPWRLPPPSGARDQGGRGDATGNDRRSGFSLS